MLDVASVWKAPVQQQNFRQLLEAMSRPGTVQSLHGIEDESNSLLAVLSALLDNEVSFCDNDKLLSNDDHLLLQAKQDDAEEADYLLCEGNQEPGFEPRLGTLASPELSATIVLKVDSITDGESLIELKGPGIKEQAQCNVKGLHPQWLIKRQEWVSAFPLGVDLILADESRVMAIPRTSIIKVN